MPIYEIKAPKQLNAEGLATAMIDLSTVFLKAGGKHEHIPEALAICHATVARCLRQLLEEQRWTTPTSNATGAED